MKQETGKLLADGATISAVSTGASSYFGWFDFVNANAPGIGILLSFFFGVIGLIFYWLTWKKATLADENKKTIKDNGEKLDLHINETRNDFKSVNDGIESILNKLSE